MNDSIKGFTLIELIVTLVVSSILVGTVGLYFSQIDADTQVARVSHQLLSDVRFAQEMAMSSNQGVDFNITGSTYSITWTDDGTDVLSTFDKTAVNRDLDAEMGASLSGSSFSFTADGLPDQAVTLSVTRKGEVRTVTILAETGYSYIS